MKALDPDVAKHWCTYCGLANAFPLLEQMHAFPHHIERTKKGFTEHVTHAKVQVDVWTFHVGAVIDLRTMVVHWHADLIDGVNVPGETRGRFRSHRDQREVPFAIHNALECVKREARMYRRVLNGEDFRDILNAPPPPIPF